MTNHPGEVATAAAGVGLMALGAGGEVGGGLLDATGVGAVAGVPINVASAGVIATGAGMTGGAVAAMANQAGGEDHVEVARTDHSSGGEPEPTAKPEPADGMLKKFEGGRKPKASELDQYVKEQGWKRVRLLMVRQNILTIMASFD